jgi:hypothetical protein
VGLLSCTTERIMANAKGRRGKGANAPVSETVKTSLITSRELHSKWQACASLTGKTANAFAVDALAGAVKWLVIHDKRKTTDHVEVSDRPTEGLQISPDAGDEAA